MSSSSSLPEADGFAQPMAPIPGTPHSLSRAASPVPSLSPHPSPAKRDSRSRSPAKRHYGDLHLDGARQVTWEAAQAQAAKVNRFQSSNQGFFKRHFRKISSSLPKFHSPVEGRLYKDKDLAGPARHEARRIPRSVAEAVDLAKMLWRRLHRWRVPLLLVLGLVSLVTLFYTTPLHYFYRRASFLGGGSKILIIVAANQGGGVMEWKGPRDWAIERDSVRNKKRYAQRWGYEIEIVDMATKKRYAHEWRESWQKVDVLRKCMLDYPHVEWFWWLDLNTFIMEPSISLQSHLFNQLARNTYRDINIWNPLNITHPFTDPYLDDSALSATGDNQTSSINLLLPQDCSGFTLGSFFLKRDPWSERLLDLWWDPVHYEQRHMQWEHKEQDALEYLYEAHPWVRPHVAFLPQRSMNSFPIGACGDDRDDRFHYNVKDRDFLVNMAGCEWGRDCWAEMYNFRELSYGLNKGYWEQFVDWVRDLIKRANGDAKLESTKQAKVRQEVNRKQLEPAPAFEQT